MQRSLFDEIFQAVCAHDRYFIQKRDCTGLLGALSHQKVTCALRMLAYATSADQLDEYIRLAESTVLKTLHRFCQAIIDVFGDTYLRTPNKDDLQKILMLHSQRGWVGCLGSLDVMKWEWKNCPMAWRGQFQSGKDTHPTIGLEAVVDCRLWFWHAYIGVPGAINDINILDQSPLFVELMQGKAPKVTFLVNNNVYEMGYYLTDGVYPKWKVLMQTIPEPLGRKQKLYAKLQEGQRKDVERAFGVLQVSLADWCLFFYLLLH